MTKKKPDTISRSQAIRHLMTDDDSPSGSWFSLAEQKRAVEVEQLARELAQFILADQAIGRPSLLFRVRALGLLEMKGDYHVSR